jgi:digeranylgeranylglycerophospholipid reductase
MLSRIQKRGSAMRQAAVRLRGFSDSAVHCGVGLDNRALALARAGIRVTVLEKKSESGTKLHTTGIIVKDAVDQIALLDTLPTMLVRRIPGVRLYAPNLRHVDLEAPGYYFLATDTPAVMRWIASEVERAGAAIAYNTVFTDARRLQSGFEVAAFGPTRFLIGADGPRSRVASALGLGASSRFLAGVEFEYAGATLADPDKLHCFIDRRLARGYIGWVLASVNGLQVGLARRLEGRAALKPNEAMDAFLSKIAPVIDLRGLVPTGVRAGIIPCGGVVQPFAAPRALLVGDAAGMVSPVTAGGIHTALKHGLAAGNAVADFLHGRVPDPSAWFVQSYPKFRAKRLLRFLFDHFQSDLAFNWLLSTRPMRSAASVVYFHRKGVFDPVQSNGRAFALPPRRDSRS